MEWVYQIANWSWDQREWLLPAVLFTFMAPLGLVIYLTNGSMPEELSNPIKRMQYYEQLQLELKNLPLPEKSAINKSDGNQKYGWILMNTRYRTEASREEFFGTTDQSLAERGWTLTGSGTERLSVKTFYYRRGRERANLYIESSNLFSEDGVDYWNFQLVVN